MVKKKSFFDRYEYLKTTSQIGEETFGYDRYLNQQLYRSQKWKQTRDKVIMRDEACDLAIPGKEVSGKRNLIIHHMNPITKEQIINNDPVIFDISQMVVVSDSTHRAIHYGDRHLLEMNDICIRKPNDTTLWRKENK